MTLANRGTVRVIKPKEAGEIRNLYNSASVFSRASCIAVAPAVSEKGQFFAQRGPLVGVLETALGSELVSIQASSATGNDAEPALDTLDVLQFTRGRMVLELSETTYFQNPYFNKTKSFTEKKQSPSKNDLRARTSYRFTGPLNTFTEDLRYLLEKVFSNAAIEVGTYDNPGFNDFLVENGFVPEKLLLAKKPISNALNLAPLGASEVSDFHEFYEYLILLHLQSALISKNADLHSGISDYEVPQLDVLSGSVPRNLVQASFKNITFLSILELLSDTCISITASTPTKEAVFFRAHNGTIYVWELS